jgi:hypothetical protein
MIIPRQRQDYFLLFQELSFVELCVQTLALKQMVVRALLDDATAVNHVHLIGLRTVLRRWAITTAVRPRNSLALASCSRASVTESMLAVASSRISMRGIGEQRAANTDQPPLPLREVHTVFQHARMVAIQQAADELVRIRPAVCFQYGRRLLYALRSTWNKGAEGIGSGTGCLG